jgi:hypothetical protein
VYVVCRGECAILLDDANLLSLKLFRTPPDVGAVAEHQVQLLLYLLLRIHERLQCFRSVSTAPSAKLLYELIKLLDECAQPSICRQLSVVTFGVVTILTCLLVNMLLMATTAVLHTRVICGC